MNPDYASLLNGKEEKHEVTKSQTKLQQLKEIFDGGRNLLIVLQDNPDPDSIASAVALRKLANVIGNLQCSMTYRGRVGRGENRALVKYLGLNLRRSEEIDFHNFDLIAVVDTQPWTGNNALPEAVEPDIVIDHHPCRRETRNCRFTDIRSNYGAASTILFEYLAAARIIPETPLATALLYAIRSDTQDLGRDTTKADMDAVLALYPLANTRVLSAIQRGKVQRDYFQVLGNGLKNAQVYGNAVITWLGELDNPDMVGEMADILLRDDETNWVLCYGGFEGKIIISIRTEQDKLHADKVIRHIVGKLGTGGGHPSYAGGQVPYDADKPRQQERYIKIIQKRFLESVLEVQNPAAKTLITP